ncbi:MAG TPA: glycosyltransferase [Candidatus Fermentibacter daniensis]|nr:glycosyltransferase [Candidatus Fermentibacter daniensis]HOG55639.1 glycosyltransferase [Candidatus Fermentibacter daniensis]HQM40140.1 glycosyltransferase [Candidatus Fermentibacter daniensis]
MVVCPGLTETIGLESPEVRRFRVPRLPLVSLNPLHPSAWPSIISVNRTGMAAVRKAVSDFQPEHILALWALPSGWWAMNAAKGRRIKYSTWSLGSDIWSLGRIPVVRNVLRTVLVSAEHRFADGLKLCDDVKRISGLDCEFLPSCRDLGIRHPQAMRTKPPYRLAFLGRWHKNKGIDLLLEALTFMDEEGWRNIEEVRIFGGGPLAGDIEPLCRMMIENGKPFKPGGFLDRSEAASLLSWADFVVIPSRVESIPVVFSDALQAGCRVISTPVGDLPDLIDESIGTVSSKATAESIRAAIVSATSRNYSPVMPDKGVRSIFNVQSAAGRLLECLRGEG